MFLSAMDGYSQELQYIGVSLFEPRLGRTKLVSLRDGGDDDEYDFMYIKEIQIDDHFKQEGASDVGAYAIRQLLHHPNLQSISSCIYILDPYEGMTQEVRDRIKAEEESEANREREARSRGEDPAPETEESLRIKEEKERRLERYARLDANQFIRNGFYQDVAVASMGGYASKKILVAARDHWESPLSSHVTASSVEFYVGPPDVRPPTGKDDAILQLTEKKCNDYTYSSGNVIDRARSDEYIEECSRLVQEGGSLSRSHALHAACALNDPTIVQCIIDMDPSTIESRDVNNTTPLMMAAVAAAGRSTNQGYSSAQPVIDILLAANADKSAVTTNGQTACGMFKSQREGYSQMMQAMMGRPVQSNSRLVPGLAQLEAKLMPPGGPTAADQSGGDSAEPGLINYGDEDMDDDGDY